ncbi:MAG: glycosyl hydrolase [Eubacteriales bacterium]|nr:glycosyl hydrolase [Eubacteriales bacterium]
MERVKRRYEIGAGDRAVFYNRTDYCVGTGRMGLALRKDYQEQLSLVQEKIGFSHIRGHGLFCDDMAIYREYADEAGHIRAEYNFTYLDIVMDSYRELGLKPFLELGFMPEGLASGEQTVFYWKGNVTPPKSYEGWRALVRATLSHLMERYGANEVTSWPVEVWNEPNLSVFWKDADMPEYFRLFEETFAEVKGLDGRFRVGGPAICGVDDARWMKSFLDFCRERGLRPDFITRHHYTTEVPVHQGHYGYARLVDPGESLGALRQTREIVDSFPEYRGLPIHITEFNTSYIPNCPLHDTNRNAAYIARLLSELGDMNESYSYWTFGDVFEESGVPFTPFHGGFGLVANGLIEKPTFWTFAFFKRLQGECVHRSDEAVIVRAGDGSYRGIVWNLSLERCGRELDFSVSLPAKEGKEYSLVTKTVDEECCNPLKLWHDLGEPANPSREQTALLREAAKPLVRSRRVEAVKSGAGVELLVAEQGVVYFELREIKGTPDRGYDWGKVMQYGTK